MTSRTPHVQPQRSAVRRLVVDALLTTAHAAIKNGAHADDVSAGLLASAIHFAMDVVPPAQVIAELRRMADEIEMMPPEGNDRAH